jgi:hypothetical protein
MEEFEIILESNNLTKTDIKKIARDEIERAIKKSKILEKEDIRKIVRDMMIKQYKFFWEKRSFWVNNV